MKIKHYFGLAVIAAMTASCSSNEDLGTAGPGTGTNETGASYASITIDLPTTSGTRSTENDQFDGGTASEYAVNDATLVIFEKGTETSENKYKFVESVPLGNLEPWKKDNESTNGITTEATITAKLKSAKVDEVGGKYYALVILNNEATTGNKVTPPSATTETYGTWNVAAKVNAGNLLDNTKGFYMANAPQFTAKDVEPTTLVAIQGIYRTKEEAQSKAATTIHVERGLAKVTVGSSSTKDYFGAAGANATGTKYSSDKVQITKWALDVTNNKSFPVHVTSGLKAGITPTDPTDQTVPAYADIWKNDIGTAPATSRFVSNSTTATFKRVYWGIDPNYSMDLSDLTKCGEQFTLATVNGSGVTWMDGSGSDKPLYCLENTFDIDHMKQGQTTRVVFKATYTPHGFTAGNTFYKIGNNTDIWNKTKLEAQIKAKAQEVLSETDADKVTVKLDATENDIAETAGTKILKEANVQHNGANVAPEEIKAINEKLGLKAAAGTDPIVGIATYASGESYYIARIKHFGDDLTPWSAGDATYGVNNDANNTKYLGRYGVLRNNWYDLNVNSISGPGYPDVPEVKPGDPDDENSKYISVSVKILDWAKRSQNVDL